MTATEPRPRVVTPAGEVFTWTSEPRNANHQNLMRCGECDTDLNVAVTVTLACTFRQCACGTPEHPHLVEQLWHRTCLPRSGKPERPEREAILNEAADALTERGKQFHGLAGDAIRRKAYGDAAAFIRKMSPSSEAKP